VGAIGVAGGVMAMKSRDEFIGWNNQQKIRNLRYVANNYRFALIKRGIGSRTLSLLATEAKREWKRKYRDQLVLQESLVQPPCLGTSYRAAGRKYLGMTKGHAARRLPLSLWRVAGGNRQKLFESNPEQVIATYSRWNHGKVVSSGPTPPKLIIVKPLHRYWRRVLAGL